jgi:hypothetical protein
MPYLEIKLIIILFFYEIKEMNRPRGEDLSLNGISYSIAFWKGGEWKTYYRKFKVQYLRHNASHIRVSGKYSQDLYFDEVLCKENNKFMIYAVPSATHNREIQKIFKEDNLDSLLFKEIFELDKLKLDNCIRDLGFLPHSYIRIINENCELRLKIYSYKNRLPKNLESQFEEKFLVTFPEFTLINNKIPSWCIIEKPKSD